MIHTRYGTEVEILGVVDDPNYPNKDWLLVQYKDKDNLQREVHISDLRATNGLQEILDAIEQL